MRIHVPAAHVGFHYLEQLHSRWDEKEAADGGGVPAPVAAQAPALPSRARLGPYRGSRQHPGLVAQAVARHADKLAPPAARDISTAASVLAPAINVLPGSIRGMSSSFSPALARGVSPILRPTMTANTRGTRPASTPAGRGNTRPRRERGNFEHRFLQPAAI